VEKYILKHILSVLCYFMSPGFYHSLLPIYRSRTGLEWEDRKRWRYLLGTFHSENREGDGDNIQMNLMGMSCEDRRWTELEPGYLRGLSDGLGTKWTGFDSRQGQEIFLYFIASRPALRPTQPPIQWVPRALSTGIKRPEREAGHSI
jgi:hypothetical protein